MNESYYKDLVRRYRDNKSTDEELEVFAHLLSQGKLDKYLAELMNSDADITGEDEQDHPKTGRFIPLLRKLSVAASIILAITIVLYWGLNKRQTNSERLTKQNTIINDFAPGGNRAVLTLANGTKIAVNETRKGKIATEGNTEISKTADGRIVYNASDNLNATVAYNTMTTPKGGQCWVILPDGSKVFLNAASSLHYPTVFTGKNRKVELTGEAYFEVKHNKAKPFHVITTNQDVQVLGTHFNINAYDDEAAVKTSLLEGSVKISSGDKTAVLKPGQQSAITPASHLILVKNVDVEAATAWKDGFFQYDHASIQMVMRQLSRWYDVTVKYEGNPTTSKFGGSIQRDLKLSKVLTILEESQVHFRIQGKEVIVMP